MKCIAPQLAYIHSDAKLRKIYQSDKLILIFGGLMGVMGIMGDTKHEAPGQIGKPI